MDNHYILFNGYRLTQKMKIFADSLLKGMTPREAHKKAGYTGSTTNSCNARAYGLLNNEAIKSYLAEQFLIFKAKNERKALVSLGEVTQTARKIIKNGLQERAVLDADGRPILDVEGKPLTKFTDAKSALTANSQLISSHGLDKSLGTAIQVNFNIDTGKVGIVSSNDNGINGLESKEGTLPPKDGGGVRSIEVPLTQNSSQTKESLTENCTEETLEKGDSGESEEMRRLVDGGSLDILKRLKSESIDN